MLVGDGGDDLLNGDAGSDTFLESGVDDAYDSSSIQRGAGGDTLNGGTPTTGTLDRADHGQRSADLTITLCTDPTEPKGGSTAHSRVLAEAGDGAPRRHPRLAPRGARAQRAHGPYRGTARVRRRDRRARRSEYALTPGCG
ncbi:hypothetical protein [Sorangium sp. So ce1153]|uniref:hypothetical protein n=1 Tax=Sorangium sp. So ce1153 TaxID=3133333 RepID=UPI003F621F17